jgi:superfamily II RNA helicase
MSRIGIRYYRDWYDEWGHVTPITALSDRCVSLRTRDTGIDAEAATVVFITDGLNSMGYASIDAFGDAIAQMDEATRSADIRRLGEILEGSAE